MIIMLSMSLVRVAPIKIPSSVQDATPTIGAAIIYGRYVRPADCTSGAVVMMSITMGPKVAKQMDKSTLVAVAQPEVRSAARRSAARLRAPSAWPTRDSAAKAKPSCACAVM